ncbi:transcription factor bHLH128-like isoform X2 [Cornus florida]|uniref:transcription factor bHLH128-like isoform X2 n=1 Tax=Cornus florida TaxID=4283 RepID=UPI00289DDE30|nr:transcription factor bHLH128-like isoform X2 [Cornus florida]
MYPSSSSSSSQGSMGQSGLIRYGSAPGSFLTTAVDSVIGQPSCEFSAVGSQSLLGSRYFSADTSSDSAPRDPEEQNKGNPAGVSTRGLQRSLGLNDIAVGDFATVNNLKNGVGSSSSSSSLVRHSSSPAGFLNHLTDNGFSLNRGMPSDGGSGISRLNSQLSFTRNESLPQISEKNENIVDAMNTDNDHRKAAHSYATVSFGMGSWDDANSIMFSSPPSKRAKNIGSNIVNNLSTVESQFSLPQTAVEMASMENLLQIPQDSVACKARAKRGCATHPRSIAERERRTRISGKLKKLQDLVPNMDKQTSYADMLDIAVNHIKGLQNQVQKLNKELDSCTCGCKETMQC